MEKKKTTLKDSNPVKYYKRKRRWLAFGKCLCLTIPALTVLIVYAIRSCMGLNNTNPLTPVKFGFGVVLMVSIIVIVSLIELKTISRSNKKDGTGPVFTASFVWLLLAFVLWLLYISTYYLIIFCAVEFIASFSSAFFTSAIKQTYLDQDKEDTAERQAKAISRAMQDKNKGQAIE